MPLAEESEQYAVSIKNGGQLVRTFQVGHNSAVYSQQQQIEDFAGVANEFEFEVAQISASEGAGIPRSRIVSL